MRRTFIRCTFFVWKVPENDKYLISDLSNSYETYKFYGGQRSKKDSNELERNGDLQKTRKSSKFYGARGLKGLSRVGWVVQGPDHSGFSPIPARFRSGLGFTKDANGWSSVSNRQVLILIFDKFCQVLVSVSISTRNLVHGVGFGFGTSYMAPTQRRREVHCTRTTSVISPISDDTRSNGP